jgi:exosortase F-associated protein
MTAINNKGLVNTMWIVISILGIVCTFLFQDFSLLEAFDFSEQGQFVGRKILRVLLNDTFMLIFMVAWFRDKKVTRLALFIQLIDGLILLPLYLILKLRWEGTSEISSPLLSQFHRLIINPTLMILLIPAIYFQKLSGQK